MDGKVVKMKCQRGLITNKDHRAQITIHRRKEEAFQVVVHLQLTEFGNTIKVVINKYLVFHIFIVIIHLISQIQIIKGHNQLWTELMVQ